MEQNSIVPYYNGRNYPEYGQLANYYPGNVNVGGNDSKSTPYEIPGCPVFSVFIATVVGILWLFFALTLPAYHYARVVFPIDNYIDLNFGLWTVHVSSNCDSFVNFDANKRICRFIVSRMDNLSISDATNFVCSLEAGTLQLLNLGCNKFHLLRIGSSVIMTMFILTIILLFFAAIFLLTFWFCYRTRRVRQSIFMLHFISALTCVLGIVGYLLVGGLTVQPFRDSSMFGIGSSMFARLFFVDISRTFDLSTGFAFAAFGMIWIVLLPLWSVCALPSDICVDAIGGAEDESMEEDDLKKLLEYPGLFTQVNGNGNAALDNSAYCYPGNQNHNTYNQYPPYYQGHQQNPYYQHYRGY
ncbi:putative transmembrane domain-containing protein [Cryptosporidium canis]|uniref:Transmembrane domain-containing protein n=1 Tax=Cryptosporidium canis TaxID=195482 RepID=A0A9D5DIX6_9CRYT|nr:putative transmembrane domain-containing protein [Cryptosporidium canis]